MDWLADASEQPNGIRYGVAGVVGTAWAFLWVGWFLLGFSSYVFWIVSVAVVAPVVGSLARGGLDLLALLGSAFGVGVALSAVLVPILDPLLDWSWRFVGDLVASGVVAWVPSWVATGAWLAVRETLAARRRA